LCDEKVSVGMAVFFSIALVTIFLIIFLAWLIIKLIRDRKLKKSRAQVRQRLLYESEKGDFDVYRRSSQAMDSVRSHIQPCTLSVLDAEIRIKNGTDEAIVLREINVQFRAGTLTAIMGPSGSGNSTLLKVLSGRTKLTTG